MTETKTLTIHDIARIADVSPTTVSFVMNDKNGISDETRKRVLDVIEKTGFTPNAHTRRLNLGKSFNVSVVMQSQASGLMDLYYLDIIFGILQESKTLGYSVLFATLDNEEDQTILLRTINDKSTDGLIFFMDLDPHTLWFVKESRIPFMVVDSHLTDDDIYPQLRVDYKKISYMATDYLIKSGHERIAFISRKQSPNYYTITFEGYKNALVQSGLHLEPSWIQPDAFDEESAYKCMNNILSSNSDRPTAVFCAGDIYAIGAMKCAKEHGLSIPDDISFIGIDDIIVSSYIEPALTTVSVNEKEMGQKTMRMMFDILNNNIQTPATNSIENMNGVIIERGSVRHY